MNGWDAIDNTVKQKTGNQCQRCELISLCVSNEGFDDDYDSRQIVCNHCYSELQGSDECFGQIADGAPQCYDCQHLSYHTDGVDCDNFNSCKYCPEVDICEDSGNK